MTALGNRSVHERAAARRELRGRPAGNCQRCGALIGPCHEFRRGVLTVKALLELIATYSDVLTVLVTAPLVEALMTRETAHSDAYCTGCFGNVSPTDAVILSAIAEAVPIDSGTSVLRKEAAQLARRLAHVLPTGHRERGYRMAARRIDELWNESAGQEVPR